MRPNLTTLLEDFRRHGEETAVVTHRGVRRYATTYAEIVTIADRFALELMRRGIHFGERVVLWGENSAAWVGVLFGCIERGVIAVPLDAAGSAEFARRVLDDVQPKLIVGGREQLDALGETVVPKLDFGEVPEALPEWDGSHVNHSIEPETPVQILFTSGTTAEPKGIVHTHRNILSSLAPIEEEMQKYLRYERWVHPLRFLHTLPLSHVFGQFMGLWIPPLLGAEVHFDKRLQPQHLIQTIHDDRISLLVAVPRVLQILRGHLVERFPLLDAELKEAAGMKIWSRWWRFRQIHALFGYKFWAFVCGGASLPAEVENFWGVLGFALIQGYGMTESSALITLNHPFKIGRGTIGKVLPGRDVRITDEGEILVRGSMISGATWRKGALHQNESEWLATGDLAQKDAAGNLRFVGRKNQVIVTPSGLNVHPEDVAAALARQPGVAACAVVPHELATGSEPAAVMIFHGSQDEAQQAIVAANTELAEHQRIRHWRIWPGLDLPRTSTGKVQLRTLTAWINRAEESGKPSLALEDELVAMLIEVTGRQPDNVTDTVRLEEGFGLDSLGRVQLQELLEEELGVALDERVLQQAETLGDLRAVLGKSGKIETKLVTEVVPEAAEGAGVSELPIPEAEPKLEKTPARAVEAAPVERDRYWKWPWSRVMRAVRAVFVEGVARPLTWVFAAPKVRRRDELDAFEPMLIVANHISTYDVPLVLYGLPGKMRRRVAIAMAADLLREWRRRRGEDLWFPSVTGPVSYWLVTALMNVFPLPRSAGFRRSFEHAGLALDRGFHVLIFPEGRRSEGVLAEFRPGIGLLAQESRTAVLPVALAGLGEGQQRRRWFHAGRVEIRVGQPLRFDGEATAEEITGRLHEAVMELLEER